jgi:hypothetical protein
LGERDVPSIEAERPPCVNERCRYGPLGMIWTKTLCYFWLKDYFGGGLSNIYSGYPPIIIKKSICLRKNVIFRKFELEDLGFWELLTFKGPSF